jgi:CheY-like chemotaxis protein
MATILVVDDEATAREALKGVIEACGHVALLALGGVEAMELLRHRPDLALIDLVMPKIDGLEVMSAMRAAAPGLQIIAMTGVKYENFDPLAVALEFGADGALNKPITAAQLSAEISRLAVRI